MSFLADFTGRGVATSPSVEKLGDVSGTVQLDLSSFKQFEARPVGPTTFTFTGLGTASNRGKANVVLTDGGTNDITWDTRLVFDEEFDGLFTQPADGIEYWDVANAIQIDSHPTPGPTPTGVFFNNDGQVMYSVESRASDGIIYQYSLSTPWDITTVVSTTSLDIGGDTSSPSDAQLSSDGTKLFVLANDINTILTYELATQWDVTTSTISNESLLLSSASYTGLFFSDNGAKMFVSLATGTVREYDLGVSWDVSTATYNNVELDVTNEMANTTSIAFSSDGTILTVTSTASAALPSGSGGVFRYDLSVPWNVGSATFHTLGIISGATPTGIFFTQLGDVMFLADNTTDSVISFDVKKTPNFWELDSFNHTLTTGNLSPGSVTGCVSVFFSTDGTRLFMQQNSGPFDPLYQFDLAAAWDLSTVSHDGVVLNIGGIEGAPRGIHFDPSGTHMYVVGTSVDTIFHYSMTTPWNLATASQQGSFNVNSQDPAPKSVRLSLDGTKAFIVGFNSRVYSYTLSTPWDITTATYDNVSLSVSGDTPQDMFFNSSGTKMFLLRVGTAGSLHSYSLTVPWLINSASYDNVSKDITEITPTCIFVNPEGSTLYASSTSFEIAEYKVDPSRVKIDIINVLQHPNNLLGTVLHTYGDGQ